MIDLSGLKTISDATIKLSEGYFSISFSLDFANKATEVKTILKNNGIDCFFGTSENSLTCFPNNHCITQLAERVATGLEADGLVVRRLIPDPKSVDKSPKVEIQSFILA